MTDARQMLLAWMLLLSVVAAFIFGVWLPLTDGLNESHSRIAELRQRIAKYESIEATRGEITADLTRLEKRSKADSAARFINAKSVTLGGAELQRRIQALVAQYGAKQTSSQPLNQNDETEIPKLQVSVNLSGSLESIQQIVFSLEQSKPRLFIEQALIQSSGSSRSARAANARARSRMSAPTSAGPMLSVRLLVTAYLQRNNGQNNVALVR